MFYAPLCELEGVGRVTARSLYAAGFRSKKQVLGSSQDALCGVKGIGPALAKRILATDAV